MSEFRVWVSQYDMIFLLCNFISSSFLLSGKSQGNNGESFLGRGCGFNARRHTRLKLSGQPGKGSQGSIARVSSNRVERRNK